MQILSDSNKDIRNVKTQPGSYEWWYFDAVSVDETYSIVVIFYEGNPFSRRYKDAMDRGEMDMARFYPAVSLSVYKSDSPVFYSFEEVLPEEASFSDENPEGNVKNNRFWREFKENTLIYHLKIDQRLPGGDRLTGELRFSSEGVKYKLSEESSPSKGKHQWNLVQPHADVVGKLNISGFSDHEIAFIGVGYHDHNTGFEPMFESFDEWYWGRAHFSGNTLVYYLMNENGVLNPKGWLFDQTGNVQMIDDGIITDDIGMNYFGLKSARKIEKQEGDIRFLIQKTSIIDDGPFYQRFLNRMVLHMQGNLYQGTGISEYICPARIHKKIFRPLVNMRIQYPGNDHWVQKNPRLYRWTW
ncbi:hydroxyneurosporene dehydrogenase [soil metagenome]